MPAVGGEWVPFPPALSSLGVPETDWEHCSDGTLCAQELAGSARPPAAAQLARDVLRVRVCVQTGLAGAGWFRSEEAGRRGASSVVT